MTNMVATADHKAEKKASGEALAQWQPVLA